MSDVLRSLVSKKKRRFLQDGYNLDLTYITDQIVAMGFPAENVEGIFRNKMSDVVRFLDERHPDAYKVYNLCAERSYDKSKFHGRVAHYPFDDHNAPPMECMRPFCQDVDAWLKQNPKHVAVVHCKAGKGRTGVMICAYMLSVGLSKTAKEALDFYGNARTKNNKGVTIPSQLRYVHYFELMLRKNITYQPMPILLTHFNLITVPHVTKDGICNPVFSVKINNAKVYSSPSLPADVHIKRDQPQLALSLPRPVPLIGDVKVELYHKQALSKEKLCHFWFNTAFIEDNRLLLTKEELDGPHKAGTRIFEKDFRIELIFSSFESPEYPLSPVHTDPLSLASPTVEDHSATQYTSKTSAASSRVLFNDLLQDDSFAFDSVEQEEVLGDSDSESEDKHSE